MNRFLSKNYLPYIISSLFLFVIVSEKSFAFGVPKNFTVAGGYWSNPNNWSPIGVPLAGDLVTIQANCNVDISTAAIGSLTVNGPNITLTVLNLPGATLSISGPINVSGTLDNEGNIDLPTLIPYAFNLLAGATYIHNPRVAEEVIFEKSTESFATTSNLYIYKWFDEAVPLCDPSKITSGTLGNVYIDIGAVTFDQDGLFSAGASVQYHRIMGSLTVNNTKIIFDDGTGGTSNLILGNVILRGTAIAIFQTGVNRLLNLTTNNFTDSSSLATDTSLLMYNSFGTLNWTVNGNLILNHNFTLAQGTMSESLPNATVTVNGNATFSNGEINFIKQCSSNLTMNVTGTTTIGSLPKFRMIDGNTGALILQPAIWSSQVEIIIFLLGAAMLRFLLQVMLQMLPLQMIFQLRAQV